MIEAGLPKFGIASPSPLANYCNLFFPQYAFAFEKNRGYIYFKKPSIKTLLMRSTTKFEHWVMLIQDKSCLCTHMIFWQNSGIKVKFIVPVP
jgi:hypothetical protein